MMIKKKYQDFTRFFIDYATNIRFNKFRSTSMHDSGYEPSLSRKDRSFGKKKRVSKTDESILEEPNTNTDDIV